MCQREKSAGFSLCFLVLLLFFSVISNHCYSQNNTDGIYQEIFDGNFSDLPPLSKIQEKPGLSAPQLVAVLNGYTLKALLDGSKSSVEFVDKVADNIIENNKPGDYQLIFAYTSKAIVAGFRRSYFYGSYCFYRGYKYLNVYLMNKEAIPAEIYEIAKLYNVIVQKIPQKYMRLITMFDIKPLSLNHYKKQHDTFNQEFVATLRAFRKIFIEKARGQVSITSHAIGYIANAIAALKVREPDEALKYLRKIDTVRTQLTLHYYYLGVANLVKGDFSLAQWYFDKFLLYRQKGSLIKSALLRKKWIAIIRAKPTDGLSKQIQKYGTAYTFSDRQALKENMLPYHKGLLYARILYDGGQYDDALEVVKNLNLSLLNGEFLTGYYYRVARIYQAQKNYQKALLQYVHLQATPNTGHYYHKKAMLEMGKIHLELGKQAKALQCFKQVESIHSNMYEASLSQESKILIDQLEE